MMLSPGTMAVMKPIVAAASAMVDICSMEVADDMMILCSNTCVLPIGFSKNVRREAEVEETNLNTGRAGLRSVLGSRRKTDKKALLQRIHGRRKRRYCLRRLWVQAKIYRRHLATLWGKRDMKKCSVMDGPENRGDICPFSRSVR